MFPDVVLAGMLADMGVDMAELSEDELSCLRGWLADLDAEALAAAMVDNAAAAHSIRICSTAFPMRSLPRIGRRS